MKQFRIHPQGANFDFGARHSEESAGNLCAVFRNRVAFLGRKPYQPAWNRSCGDTSEALSIPKMWSLRRQWKHRSVVMTSGKQFIAEVLLPHGGLERNPPDGHHGLHDVRAKCR